MQNKFDSELKDFILLQKSAIPKDICKYTIENLNYGEWYKHWWHHNTSLKRSEDVNDNSTELDIQNTTDELQNLLTPYIVESAKIYSSKVSFLHNQKTVGTSLNNLSLLRFNRYSPGQLMKCHVDHIRTLWEYKNAGIPILSVIINLNDEYDGGKIVFWDDYSFELGTGDILMWPSLFLYPHRVDKIKSGERYSAVSWLW